MREINDHWYGVLNAENIDAVAAEIRKIVSGRFCIAEALYVDSKHADLRLISPACRTDSQWTSAPVDEQVRVFKDEHAWIGFSAGGYLWTFNARPDNSQEHEGYRYPYFSFNRDRFTVTDRAPAGEGHLHQRAFGRIDDEIQ